ncbi:MAG: hypothetical protein HUU21_36200 [Polyangiaceae bacterium]|nr:hypothetical protein [Polyangiaceae bacterium]
MNTEKFGGVFLLHQAQSKRLLGSLRSITSDTGPGWVHGSFFEQAGSIGFSDVGDKTEFILSRDVAVSLIGLLPVLVATCSYIRNPNKQWSCEDVESGEISVCLRLDIKESRLIISWASDPERTIHQIVGDQVEWRIREDFAMALVVSIVRHLAQTAANAKDE